MTDHEIRGPASEPDPTGEGEGRARRGGGAAGPVTTDGLILDLRLDDQAGRTEGDHDQPEEADDWTATGDLHAEVRSSLRWSILSQAFVRVISFASGIVLWRFLTKEDYGLYFFALAVVTILMGVNDLGQVLAITRWQGPGLRSACRTATTLAWSTTAACYAAVFFAAPLITGLAGREDATWALRLLACLLLIDGVSTVPRALLFRTFRHARAAAGDLVGVLVNTGLSVGLAVAGLGVWAPIIGTIGAALVTAGMVLWLAPGFPLPGFDRDELRRLLGFGVPLATTSLVEYGLLNVDYLIIAKLLGIEALALYALAFNVSSWPASLMMQAIRRVSVAGFAHASGSDGPAASFHRSFVLLVRLVLPACAILAVTASALLRTLYGEKGVPAATMLAWLVALGGVRVAVGLVADLLLAEGRSRVTLRIQVIWLVVVAPLLYLGARLAGGPGVAAAHTLVAVLVALPLFLAGARSSGVSPTLLAHRLVRPLLGTALAVAVGMGLAEGIQPTLAELLTVGAGMLVVYAVVSVRRSDIKRLRTER